MAEPKQHEFTIIFIGGEAPPLPEIDLFSPEMMLAELRNTRRLGNGYHFCTSTEPHIIYARNIDPIKLSVK